MNNELINIINNLPMADFIALHNTYCNNEEYGGDPDKYIYPMHRFNEMHENMKPDEIVACTASSNFDITDAYWFETDDGEFSFTSRTDKNFMFAPTEITSVYADFVEESGKDCGVQVLADWLKNHAQQASFTDWNKVSARVESGLTNGIDELFYDIQNDINIEFGDVNPHESFILDEKIEELRDIIVDILKHQKGEM